MTINSYIKKFGDFTIEERPLGPVDFIILAELSMISFDSLLNKNNVVKFKNIQEDQITPKLFEDSPDRRLNKKQLIGMINSKRFKDLEIRHVQRIFSETSVNQFYAITIVFPDGTFYISYRGTDITMVGWKEDFTIVLQDTFLGQEEAVEYLKDVINKEKGNFYIGGHSKGGNVALYAALHLNQTDANRLIQAHSFDGPGMRTSIKEFPGYEYVFNKMVKYRTYNNVIGAVYNQFTDYKVVRSTGLLLGGHDVYYWQINPKTGDFIYAKDISPASKVFTKRFMKWVNSLSLEDRHLITDTVFLVFDDCDDIYDLAKYWVKDLVQIKKKLADYPEEDVAKLKKNIKKLIRYLFVFNKNKK